MVHLNSHRERMFYSMSIVLILFGATSLQMVAGLPSDVHIHMHLDEMDDHDGMLHVK